MSGHDAVSGRKVLDVAYGPTGGANFGLGIHRASLFNALMDVAILDGISITPNYKIISTYATDTGRFITFENGKTIGPFDLVVDTTGASSPISALVSTPLPYGAIWGAVD
jgi:hypothetical protein